MKRFEDFGLKKETMNFIRLNGFKEPTPIQEEVIPAALRGRDVIGLSSTGSGKTHAYLIPLFEKIDASLNRVQAIVTAPTRELAIQIHGMAMLMTKVNPDIRIRLFVGGSDREKDARQLANAQPHLVIGTPGRMKDMFLDTSVLRCDTASVMVVDEADMTMEFGFLDDVDAIAGRLKDDLQMMSFSATMPEQLRPFIRKYMHQPITFEIGERVRFNPDIHHILVPCYHHDYAETIYSILPGFQPFVCLIFANTRKEASEVAQQLREKGLSVTEIHGDLSSRQRKQSMKAISNAERTFVVATDLAARGIDIGEVTHVISCGFPKDLEYYVHRAGRTGRAGSSGTCFALYKDRDDMSIRSLMKRGIKFDHMRYKKSGWQKLQPYGQKRVKRDTEMEKQISRMMAGKKTKVKPGYKKKRKEAIEQLQRKKRQEFIRSKIREQKKAMYRERARQEKENGNK